ncbi:hypothetical protein HA402_000677 [Bradysia odoriphaga]|nr:hypothetical protein HA402_000677 [Bradysia odoriphaga]
MNTMISVEKKIDKVESLLDELKRNLPKTSAGNGRLSAASGGTIEMIDADSMICSPIPEM